MLRQALLVVLLICALLVQIAGLNLAQGASTSVARDGVSLCETAGDESGQNAPVPHPSSGRCVDCLACNIGLITLAAIVAALVYAELFSSNIRGFARRPHLARTARRVWRPPVRAPPVIS